MNRDQVMKLGGNIELVGFDDIDKQHMIILKKIIGNHVKDLSSSEIGYKKLEVFLEDSPDDTYMLSAKLICDETFEASCNHPNILVCIDRLIKKVCNNGESA